MVCTGTQTPAVNIMAKKTTEPMAAEILVVRETAQTSAPSASTQATASSRPSR